MPQDSLFVCETSHLIPSSFLSFSFSGSETIRIFYLKKVVCFLFCLWREPKKGKRQKKENLMRVQEPSSEFVCIHSRQTHNFFITGEKTQEKVLGERKKQTRSKVLGQ